MSLVPSKRVVKEIAAEGGRLFTLMQRVLRLTDTQSKHAALLEKQAQEIERLTDLVRTLQAREEVLLARSEAAATKAAADTISDLARRIGYLEGRGARRDD